MSPLDIVIYYFKIMKFNKALNSFHLPLRQTHDTEYGRATQWVPCVSSVSHQKFYWWSLSFRSLGKEIDFKGYGAPNDRLHRWARLPWLLFKDELKSHFPDAHGL